MADQIPDSAKSVPSSDLADILVTIQNAADDWQKQGYPTALAEVRDMANVGRALMTAIADNAGCPPLKGWHPADCPSEIVSDLLNMLDDATRASPPAMDREAVERIRALYETHLAWPVKKHPRNGGTSEEWEPYFAANRARTALLEAIPSILSTLSADAIRQGEGIEGAVRLAVWNAAKKKGVSDEAAMATVEAVVAELPATPATPASHASDGGEA